MNEKQIKSWASHQRRCYRDGTLSADKIAKLETIPGWTWHKPTPDDKWKEWCGKYEQHVERTGRRTVEKDENPKLHQWCNMQRTQSRLRGDNFPKYRIDRLNEIGFVWDKEEEAWNNKFEELKQLGHSNVGANDSSLGTWIYRQRKAHREGRLSVCKYELLEPYGVFTTSKRRKWLSQVDRLVEFKKRHGHTRVSKTEDATLHSFVRRMRSDWRNKDISDFRINKLNEIGFEWEVGRGSNSHREGAKKFDHERNYKAIVKLTLDGKYVATYKSIKEARESIDGPCGDIGQVCKGRRNKAGGFKWIYKEDYNN